MLNLEDAFTKKAYSVPSFRDLIAGNGLFDFYLLVGEERGGKVIR